MLKFQAIFTSDGICNHFFSSEVGRCHDIFLYAELDAVTFTAGLIKTRKQQRVLYSDSGYSVLEVLEMAFDGGYIETWQTVFNAAMSKV